MASLAPVAQWIEYLTSNQSVACSNHAGGIFYLMTSNPQERGRVSVGCVFESRRGHFLFNDFEPPGKGAGVSRLRVCPFGVQANHAGGIFYSEVACLPLRGTGESRRVPSVLLHVQVAGTVKTDALAIIKEFVTASP